MRTCRFLRRRAPIPGVGDSFLSRLLGQRTASISVGRYGNKFKGLFFSFDHLSLQDDGITPGGNSVKIFKQFREGPERMLGRGH